MSSLMHKNHPNEVETCSFWLVISFRVVKHTKGAESEWWDSVSNILDQKHCLQNGSRRAPNLFVDTNENFRSELSKSTPFQNSAPWTKQKQETQNH